MRLITDGPDPQPLGHVARAPPTKAEMTATAIMKIRVVSASAKVRVGGPAEDRRDAEVVGRVWTGVLPVWECMGKPVAGGKDRVEDVPGWVGEWRGERNRVGEGVCRGGGEDGV